MKHFSFIFIAFISVFALQNANAGDTLYLGNPLTEAYVLWRVHFQPDPLWSERRGSGELRVKIDSVLRGNFFINEEWRGFIDRETIEKSNIKLDTSYHLILIYVVRLKRDNCTWRNSVHIREEYIFPDTPENREKLSKKWDETTVIYKDPKPREPDGPIPGIMSSNRKTDPTYRIPRLNDPCPK